MAEDQIVGSPEREIYVKPIVSLTKLETVSKDDDETEEYKSRCKLYRFHMDEEDGPTWKERGVGELKIMKHNTKPNYRIIMRRDKTLKICANHNILATMELKPHNASERAFIWSTPSDFSDNEKKAETLCIRFGKPETASIFKKKFEDIVKILNGDEVTTASEEKSDATKGEEISKDMSSLKVSEEEEKSSKDSNFNINKKERNGET